jgi:hypothetical protein
MIIQRTAHGVCLLQSNPYYTHASASGDIPHSMPLSDPDPCDLDFRMPPAPAKFRFGDASGVFAVRLSMEFKGHADASSVGPEAE